MNGSLIMMPLPIVESESDDHAMTKKADHLSALVERAISPTQHSTGISK